MSASEFAFLALGLVLGIATGAALIEVIRSRPPVAREIRVTVAPDSVPRRVPATLSTGAVEVKPAEPARGGPADRREHDRIGSPSGAPAAGASIALRAGSGSYGASAELVGIAIHREPDPTLAALRQLAGTVELVAARATSPLVSRAVGTRTSEPRSVPAPTVMDAADPATSADATGETPSDRPAPGGTNDPEATGPCAEARRVADERCAHAVRAREHAEAARDALRAAQRAYDDHLTRADRAAADADPRAIRAAKEVAQQTFRAARTGATDREQLEAAARDWLTEINRINVVARDAAVRLERERASAAGLVAEIERLTVDADAARIGSESADEACIAARDAVADCDEAAAAPAASLPVGGENEAANEHEGHDTDAERVAALAAHEQDASAMALATGDAEPAILRLVRGDRAALLAVVDGLAAGDPSGRRRWQLGLSGLVEAIVSRAIEAASLEFPADGFWAGFSQAQDRDIAAALSALGYRFDGLGGWVDERVPSQRDLSLAVGYAGLDPMRIRHWPDEAEMRELFRDVRVAADEYLVGVAPGLTLGELVGTLGVRADALTELWNEWGRLRPALLAGT